MPQRVQHRVVRFFASVALNTLTTREAQALHVHRSLALEGIDQRRFADARLPGDQDELALPPHGQLQVPTQLPESARAAHQGAGR